ERVDLDPREDEPHGRLDEPVVLQPPVVTGRSRGRETMRRERLVEEIRAGIVEVHIVEVVAYHAVGKEAALGDHQVGPGKRDLETRGGRTCYPRRRKALLGCRGEIAGRGADVDVPTVPHVEARDVRTDLDAPEALMLLAGAGDGPGLG